MPNAVDPKRQRRQNVTILVVEDDPDLRDELGDLLRDAGWQVGFAEHGKAALERLSNPPLPDLVLLDLFMPVMDGFELLRRMRQHPDLTSVPVVVVTAADAFALQNAGVVTESLAKPVDVRRLLETLDRHTGA